MRRTTIVTIALASALSLKSACSDDPAPTDAAPPGRDGATPGADARPPADDGKGPEADALAPPADGRSPATACPADPPLADASCAGFDQCNYLRCPGEGLVVALCNGGQWQISSSPCAESECFGLTCDADQLCLDQSGGAQIGQCVNNPCGDGPVTCDCLASICGASPDCAVTGPRTFRCTAPCGECP